MLASKSGLPLGQDQWWSADVGDFIRDSGIGHMRRAKAASKPFYLHLWWHMSHDRIDPRPEQCKPYRAVVTWLRCGRTYLCALLAAGCWLMAHPRCPNRCVCTDNTTFPFRETCLFPATASCQAAGGGESCEPCNWQIFWGVQTYSDRFRFGPVIGEVDSLGIRDNTYIIFSTDNGAQGERWTSNRGGSGPGGDTSGAFTNAVGMNGPFRGTKASLYDGESP